MSQRNEYDVTRFYKALNGRKCGMLEAVEWVFENMARPIEVIEASEPPGLKAIHLHGYAYENPEKFIEKFVPLLMPTQKQLEVSQRTKEDGRALSILDRMETEFYAERPAA